jgi:ATP/maltotriose-dependent transcriptional regulator MalT
MLRACEPLFGYYISRTITHEGIDIAQKAVDVLGNNPQTIEEKLLLGVLLAAQTWCYAHLGLSRVVDSLIPQSLAYLQQFRGHPAIAMSLMLIADAKIIPGSPGDEAESLIREALQIYQAQNDRWGIACGFYALGRFNHTHIHYAQAREYLTQSLVMFREIGQPFGVCLALSMLSEVAYTLGDYEASLAMCEEIVPLLEQVGNFRLAAQFKSSVAMHRAAYDSGEQVRVLLESLKSHEEARDTHSVAWTLYEIGTVLLFDGYPEEADSYYLRALAIFRALSQPSSIAWTLIWQAMIETQRMRPDKAENLLKEALGQLENLTFPWGVSGAYYVWGDVELARGNLDKAQRYFLDAVRIAYDAQSLLQTLRHLAGIAALWLTNGELQRAAALATFLNEHPVSWKDTTRRTEQMLQDIAQNLSPKQMKSAQERGRQLTLEAIIAELFPKS